MSEWRDMNSAPTNGRRLLGIEDDGTMYVIWWEKRGFGGGLWLRDGDDYNIFAEPAHWTELPEPPTASSNSAEPETADIRQEP